MPLLNTYIMSDNGSHMLEAKMELLTNLVKDHPDTSMSVNKSEELLADEEFIQKACVAPHI